MMEWHEFAVPTTLNQQQDSREREYRKPNRYNWKPKIQQESMLNVKLITEKT